MNGLCKDCKYWNKVATKRDKTTIGECRHNPPVVLPDGNSCWPTSMDSAWCGSYEFRNDNLDYFIDEATESEEESKKCDTGSIGDKLEFHHVTFEEKVEINCSYICRHMSFSIHLKDKTRWGGDYFCNLDMGSKEKLEKKNNHLLRTNTCLRQFGSVLPKDIHEKSNKTCDEIKNESDNDFVVKGGPFDNTKLTRKEAIAYARKSRLIIEENMKKEVDRDASIESVIDEEELEKAGY